MDFVRPEVTTVIWRFRDAMIGAAVSFIGLYWAINGVGFMVIVGTSVTVAGALLVFAGIQRGRFRAGSGGAGIVHVDEGQVTYYGPIDGGSIVIANLERVDLNPRAKPVGEWILFDPTMAPLCIPTNAEGSEFLFDVFAGLEGMQTEQMLTALNSNPKEQIVVWQAKPVALH
ncbi:MAG: hypothetical protein ACU0CA_08225 [Paracoccaceae bacterium]